MPSAITAMPPIVGRLPVRVCITGFLVAAGFFGIALYQAFAAEGRVREQAAQTSSILLALQEALQTGVDAETGQRGYLLTGDPTYLETYRSSQERWLDQLDAIAATFSTEEALQQTLLQEMQGLAEAKLAEMQETIDLVDGGDLTGAIALVQTGRGKAFFDDFRRTTAELAAVEQGVLARQLRETDGIERRAIVMLGVLTVICIGLMSVSVWLERRTTRAELSARDAAAMREAYARSDLLAREMDHRVKNLFTVIGAMVSHSARSETELKPALETLRGRINALSYAHAVSKGTMTDRIANLRAVIEATLVPFLTGPEALSIKGETLDLPVRTVSPLGLIFYELATNATKYGAWSDPDGRVAVSWTRSGDEAMGQEVELFWRETAVPSTDDAPEDAEGSDTAGAGFGSVMLQQAALQIDGTLTRTETGAGTEVVLRFPI